MEVLGLQSRSYFSNYSIHTIASQIKELWQDLYCHKGKRKLLIVR